MEEKVEELALHLVVVEKALATLEEALAEPFSLLVRDAAIQRFEYTFELAWKLFRRLAKIEGIEVGSPRQTIRAIYDVGVLGDVLFRGRRSSRRTSVSSRAAAVRRAGAIAPGFFHTTQNHYLLFDEKTGDLTARGKSIIDHTPMKRFGVPRDLLGAVLWLLSPAAQFVSGAVIPIDGAFSAFSGV